MGKRLPADLLTPTQPEPPLLVSTEDAGRLLGVSRRQVYRLWQSGALPSVTIGDRRLFRRCDIEAFVAARFAADNPQRSRAPGRCQRFE